MLVEASGGCAGGDEAGGRGARGRFIMAADPTGRPRSAGFSEGKHLEAFCA